MKNRERFKDLIMSGKCDCDFVKEHILKYDCFESKFSCTACRMIQALWLDEEAEAEEEEVNWSKVEVDTPILASNDGVKWWKGHFSRYESGKVYTFYDGRTSWTMTLDVGWKYAKLVEEIEVKK